MATTQTTTDLSEFSINHALGHDDSDDLFWLESQLSLLHSHHNNHVGVSQDGHLNEWLADQMIESDEIEAHITKLTTDIEPQNVDGRKMLEVLRFKTDLPEIKEATRLLDEHSRYTVEIEAEGVIISIKRSVDSLF